MTTEQAKERIESRLDKWALDDEDLQALKVLIPELAESDDERIRKELLCHIQGEIDTYDNMVSRDYDSRDKEDKKVHEMLKRARAYLEKQKESNIDKLRKISTPADENWFEIQKKWDEEDKQKEQKLSEWSKEDYHWEGLVQLLRDYQKTIDRQSNNMAYEDVESYITWLKSFSSQLL